MLPLTHAPLVCLETLRLLEEELEGDSGLCHAFVSRYISMLPTRVERLHCAILGGRHSEALDAALSIRSASLMVGAARLGHFTSDLISRLESKGPRELHAELPALQLCGNQTLTCLRNSYLNVA